MGSPGVPEESETFVETEIDIYALIIWSTEVSILKKLERVVEVKAKTLL